MIIYLGGKSRRGGRRNLISPDSVKLAAWSAFPSNTDGNAARVDEEIKFLAAERRDPFKPLNTSREASLVDNTRWQAVGRKGKAATTRTAQRLFGNPGRSVVGREVGLKHELELDDSGGRVTNNEGTSQERDSVGEGDLESGGSRESHCVN